MLVRNSYTHDTRVEKEARSLTDAGYDVTVVADAAPGLPAHERRPDGTTVVRVERALGSLPGLRLLLHDLRLAGVLRALAPDVLHAHDSNALVPVTLAARRLGVPFVYDAHELWLHRPRRGRGWLYSRLFEAYYRLIHRWSLPRAAATLTVSAHIARHLARHYGLREVALVPNYPELDPGREVRSIHDLAPDRIPADAPIVLHLGGLIAERGLEELVRAMASRPDAHLVFLGTGADWPALRDLAQELGIGDRVHQLDPVPSHEVVAYTRSAAIGVVATAPTALNNRYSLPNKLFQYMAAGIPVVASDLPEIRGVVASAGAGYLVDPERPEAIAEALGRLLDDPVEARAMGARGSEAIESRFNWTTAADSLVAAYRALDAP